MRILISFILMVAAVALLHHGLPFDDLVTSYFYKGGHFMWPKSDPVLTFWLHTVVKNTFAVFAGLCGLIALVSFFIPSLVSWRRPALLVMLSIILTTVTVAAIKDQSHRYCPGKLERYGGYAPDHYQQSPLSAQEVKKADCYPAAHPSPGFALLVLGAMATTRRKRIWGYGVGFASGAALSFIQLARGEHFISHCLATMLIALWISHLLVKLFPKSK